MKMRLDKSRNETEGKPGGYGGPEKVMKNYGI